MAMPESRPRPTLLARKLRNDPTEAEKRLWCHLSRRQLQGYKFSRQMPVGPFICDFMCREAKLIVEVDGGQHDPREPLDQNRTTWIEQEGYKLIRFWNNEVFDNLDGVLETIRHALSAGPPPAPPASGRGVA